MSKLGWAYVKGKIVRETGGSNGSIQVRTSENEITGSNSLTYDIDTGQLTISGSLNVSGSIYANEFKTDVVNKSVSHISATGSTDFGDSTDDMHSLTGSFSVSGSSNTLIHADAVSGRIGIGNTTGASVDKLLHVFGDAKIEGTLHGGSPLKIAGGIQLQDGLLDASSASITALSFTGSGASLTNLPVQTYINGTDNRIITSTGANGINAEANLTFDGSSLVASGSHYTLIANTTTGKVGIKTDSPTYELDVAGDMGIDGTLYHNGDTDTKLAFNTNRVILQAGGANALDVRGDTTPKRIDFGAYDLKVLGATTTLLFADYSADKVGIRTASPTHDLAVSGTMAVSGNVLFENNLTLSGSLSSHSNISSSATISASYFYGDGSNLSGVIAEWDGTHNGDGQITGSLVISGSGGLMLQAQASTGRVGINTLSPTHLLHVNGDVKIEGILTSASPLEVGCSMEVEGQLSASHGITGSTIHGISFHGSGANLTNLPVQTYNNGTDNRVLTSAGADSINGEANLTFDGTSLVASGSKYTLIANTTTGKVGIGTNSPTYELDVDGDIGVSSTIYHNDDTDTKISFHSDRVILHAGGGDALDIRGDTTPKRIDVGSYDFKTVHGAGGGGTLLFSDYSAGNVGIKTDAPSHALSVSGTMAVSGNVTLQNDLSASGVVSASYFYGDGSNIYGVTGEWDGSHNGNGNITGSFTVSASSGVLFHGDSTTGKVGLNTGVLTHDVTLSGSAVLTGSLNITENLEVLGNITSPDSTINIGSNTQVNGEFSSSLGITGSSFHGSASGLTGLPVQTYTAGSNNRILTSAGTDSINGEANLSFSGTLLEVTGNLVVSGSKLAAYVDSATGKVGIGTDNPTYELDVEGDIGVSSTIYHNGDTDTKVSFHDNRVIVQAGGQNAIDIRGDTSPKRIDIGQDIHLSGNLLPTDANVFDLGSASKPWRDLYVSSSTIYFGSETLSVQEGSLRFGHENANKDFRVGNLKLRDKGIFVPSGSVFDLFAQQMRFYGGVAYKRRAVGWDYTILATESIIGIGAITASIALTLPAASTLENGQVYTIKDEMGDLATYSASINVQGSDTIDGQTSVTLESPYAAINIYTNGTNKFFIY
jgi:cytoskeletal protein CcmA (bactofilin family)